MVLDFTREYGSEPLRNQDFVGGIQNRRNFVSTQFRLPIPIFNFGGGDNRVDSSATQSSPTLALVCPARELLFL